MTRKHHEMIQGRIRCNKLFIQDYHASQLRRSMAWSASYYVRTKTSNERR